MRVALLNSTQRAMGGVETYLARVAPRLQRAGCELGFFCENDAPATRPPVELPPGVERWCVEALGRPATLDALRAFRPDVLYVHGMHDMAFERGALACAPGVFFAHAFHGTCISGRKCHSVPAVEPCARPFGPACLVNFYPRRCGGLNPVRMVRDYRVQLQRLEILRLYHSVATTSDYMREEYVRNGLAPERVRSVSCIAWEGAPPPLPAEARADAMAARGRECRLVFVGRMDFIKGGRTLIAALPAIRSALGVPVSLTLAGDGPDRAGWEAAARLAEKVCDGVTCEFLGWQSPGAVARVVVRAHLLVCPSLWPEPFGLVGLEAAALGVPAAAFDVGGVRAWLRPGESGELAPGAPPTAAGLAEAVNRALSSPEHYARLCAGARGVAESWNDGQHVEALLEMWHDARAHGRPRVRAVPA